MPFSRFDKDFKQLDKRKMLNELSAVKVKDIKPIQANSIEYKGRQLCQK